MIGLDTNVIVRYIAQDDVVQSKKAAILIESLSSETTGFITLVSILELVWVLQGAYQSTKDEIVTVLHTLLKTKHIIVEQSETLWQSLRVFERSKAEFLDCLIERSAHAAGCEYTVTFDRGASKSAGMRLIE